MLTKFNFICRTADTFNYTKSIQLIIKNIEIKWALNENCDNWMIVSGNFIFIFKSKSSFRRTVGSTSDRHARDRLLASDLLAFIYQRHDFFSRITSWDNMSECSRIIFHGFPWKFFSGTKTAISRLHIPWLIWSIQKLNLLAYMLEIYHFNVALKWLHLITVEYFFQQRNYCKKCDELLN